MAPRNAQGYAALIKRKLDALPAQVRDAVRAAQNQNADEMVTLAKSLAPKKTGALQASIHKEPTVSGCGAQVVAGDETAFYARFVEFGTRAGVEGNAQSFVEKQTLDRGTEDQRRT